MKLLGNRNQFIIKISRITNKIIKKKKIYQMHLGNIIGLYRKETILQIVHLIIRPYN